MFQIFIDNEEVVCENQFSIEEEFMNPSSIELYKVSPKSWKGTDKILTDYYFPEDYTKCKILKDGELYFTGIVKNSADMELSPFKPHYCSLQILDPSTLLSEGNTLDYVITNKTVTEAIEQIINSISNYGFVAGNINISSEYDTIIGAYSTLDKTPFDVFQYLSQVSQSRWGTRMVDEDITAIDFYDPETLENKEEIQSTKEYFTKNKIEAMYYEYSTVDFRNKQVITSDEIFGNVDQIQTIISNGYMTTYTTEQKIGKINSITVNGVNKTFATIDEKDLGVNADFYYKPSESIFNSNEIYNAGARIIITYVPIVQGREVVFNNNEINRINSNIGRNGIIARYENRNDVTSSSELQSVAKTYIKYKGLAEITLTIRSRIDFLKLGEKHYFNAPIDKLKSNYLVKTKTTYVTQNGKLCKHIYEYKLSNSFDTENEINYFDNQRTKARGNIAQGEYIARNIDIDSGAYIIFDDYVVEEVGIDGNNTLNGLLDFSL